MRTRYDHLNARDACMKCQVRESRFVIFKLLVAVDVWFHRLWLNAVITLKPPNTFLTNANFVIGMVQRNGWPVLNKRSPFSTKERNVKEDYLNGGQLLSTIREARITLISCRYEKPRNVPVSLLQENNDLIKYFVIFWTMNF